MPWRLIQFIVIFAIFLLFVVLNLENKCDISFGFAKAENIPVFLTVFIAFMAGILCTLPVALAFRARKKEKTMQGKGLLAKASDKKQKRTIFTPKDAEKPDDSGVYDSRNYGID